MNNNRRRLLQGSLGLGLPAWALSDAVAQQGLAAAGGFDLVIFGGRVIDPSQNIDKVADVAIKNGRVALIQTGIDPKLAAQKIDASGKIVTPGLVDLHAHVYPQASAIGLPADELAQFTATTTFVSAGDAGANNFSAFKHYIQAQARSRMYAFIHISSIG